jgi:glycosyltransferase involved in cell wall biosynthesis
MALDRVLIAIPAYNEQATIGSVVQKVRKNLPDFDLLVVNDGSTDSTGQILKDLRVVSAVHLCNLGYGRGIQTALKYALSTGYDFLITLDADGQHHPEQVQSLYKASRDGRWDVLIGSRHVETHDYSHAPLGRRIGMQLFSMLVKIVSGQRVYDTTSGLKVIKRAAFEPLTRWHFVDFHAEAIVYLTRMGYTVGEYPITVAERTEGQSMYSFFSLFTYPLNTTLMVLLGVVEAGLTQKKRRP